MRWMRWMRRVRRWRMRQEFGESWRIGEGCYAFSGWSTFVQRLVSDLSFLFRLLLNPCRPPSKIEQSIAVGCYLRLLFTQFACDNGLALSVLVWRIVDIAKASPDVEDGVVRTATSRLRLLQPQIYEKKLSSVTLVRGETCRRHGDERLTLPTIVPFRVGFD